MNETTNDNNMRDHYDFSQGVKGKYKQFANQPYTIKVHHKDGTTMTENIGSSEAIFLEPDVREYFPDSETVNKALRGLIQLIPKVQQDKVSDSVG